MLLRRSALTAASPPRRTCRSLPGARTRRRLMTLAVETSCDDTSVAVVEKGVHRGSAVARLHFHKKVTSNNHVFQGVHPLLTLKSHQENLAGLVAEAIQHLPSHGGAARLPDFVSVTRGPGMRSNLMCGLDTAKGLAAAWQKPLVGVHHMQAHALTPRLVAALDAYNALDAHDALDAHAPGRAHLADGTYNTAGRAHLADGTYNTAGRAHLAHGTAASTPAFPILSVLASGGHTLLIRSASLTAHTVLGSTDDIAVGECLDKTARVILPASLLDAAKSTMYGALLETFAFPDARPLESKCELSGLTASQYMASHGSVHAWYTPPPNNELATSRCRTKWGWSITQPLTKTGGGTKINTLGMSFSGLMTAVERLVRFPTDPATGKLCKQPRSAQDVSLEERRDMALGVMRAAFEHVASRVVLALQPAPADSKPAVVVAGGVASNAFLRHVLAATLVARGHADVRLFFPPPEYCTDNAAMIAWAGLEMFDAGYADPLTIRAVRKWPLDELLSPVYDDKI